MTPPTREISAATRPFNRDLVGYLGPTVASVDRRQRTALQDHDRGDSGDGDDATEEGGNRTAHMTAAETPLSWRHRPPADIDARQASSEKAGGAARYGPLRGLTRRGLWALA